MIANAKRLKDLLMEFCMKTATKHEIISRDSSVADKIELEERQGLPYNWILANYYSLSRFLKEHNLSDKDCLIKNVICEAVILDDKAQEIKQDRLRNSKIATIDAYFCNTSYSFDFVDRELTSVPLLFLKSFAFSQFKEKILTTRMYDSQKENRSSDSAIKLYRKNVHNSFLNSEVTEIINNMFACKSRVFLIPISMEDGSDVDWYVPLDNCDNVNRDNALLEMEKYQEIKHMSTKNTISDDKLKELAKKNTKLKKFIDSRNKKSVFNYTGN